MAASWQRLVAAFPPPLHVVFLGAFAASLAPQIDAARLDRRPQVEASDVAAPVPTTTPAESVARAQRELDLRIAADYLDELKLEESMSLGSIRNILERFEELRKTVLGSSSLRDTRSRYEVRRILKEIREMSEVLNELAAQKESEGETDDGGDAFPSERDNICNSIYHYEVESDFREMVRRLCQSLDALRSTVFAGHPPEQAVFEVSGRVNAIRAKPPYTWPDISSGISCVLGEERRWVTRQLARMSAVSGAVNKSVPSPEGAAAHEGLFKAWAIDAHASVNLQSMERERGLKLAYDAAQIASTADNVSLSRLRTSLQRLEFRKERLAEHIMSSDTAFRERIREVLVLIKNKKAEVQKLIELKAAAGEPDDGGDTLPSQRENICKNPDEFSLAHDLREEVRNLCDSLDRMRSAAILGGGAKEAAVMEVMGRVHALKQRRGYDDMQLAGEIEYVLAEEWRWLNNHAHRVTVGE